MVSLITGGALRGSTLARLVYDTDAPLIETGVRFGPYTIERLIGRGGTGAVYLARRDVGFEQCVAIKAMRTDSPWARRFAGEQELLGRLSHSAIVRIFDAGQTDGFSWLAMEYVEGPPIDHYIAAHDPAWRTRVAILAGIGDALHYAHRELVVHGDLKPSNVLIGPHGDPKIVDFGIATDLRNEACAEDRAFTPAFASPEQIDGLRLTTASDVFQFGRLIDVLCLSADANGAAPPMPSWARSSIQAIVARATATRPADRYDSAAAVAEDLRALPAHRPLRALPDSGGYRMRVFLRRHAGAVAATVALGLALAGGLVASLWQAHIARTYAAEAEAQAHNAGRTKEFVISLLQSGNPEMATERAPRTIAEFLHGAETRIDAELADVPAARAEMHVAIGTSLAAIGKLDEGIAALERGVAQSRALGAPARRNLALALQAVASRYVSTGRHEDATAATREALAIYDAIGETLSLDRLSAMTTLARVSGLRMRHDEQYGLYRKILEDRTALLGADDSRLAEDWNNLAATAFRVARYGEAERAYREALRVIVLSPAVPEARQAWLRAGLGAVYANSERLAEAESELSAGLEIAERTLSPEHHIVGSLLVGFANVRRLQGRFDEAETFALRATKLFDSIHHVDLHSAELQLGYARLGQARFADAERAFTASAQSGRDARGEDEPMVWLARAGAGYARMRQGDETGFTAVRDAVDRLSAHPKQSRRALAQVYRLMTEAQAWRGDRTAARAFAEREQIACHETLGADHSCIAMPIVPAHDTTH